MRNIPLIALLLALACNGAAHAATLLARDAQTGAPVAAELRLSPAEGNPLAPRQVAIDGRAREVDLAGEAWRAQASAAGYEPLAALLAGSETALTLLLEPVQAPAAFRDLDARAALRPDLRWLQGHVRRADDGTPIAGATISVDGHVAHSGVDGDFEIELGHAADRDPGAPLSIDVVAAGHDAWHRDGWIAASAIQRLVIALGDGVPAHGRFEIGALDRAADLRAGGDGEDGAQAPAREVVPPHAHALAPVLAPPETIRVGFGDAACTQSCCTGSCTNTCVLPLETYVRRGLDSEWIAGWNTQSLRAGSVAYRSYGAWRVAHPIHANFDICSSACCQVNDAGTASSTDQAIARTPGLLLTRNASEAASAEYSAENNSWDDPGDGLSCSNVDLSCGDGYAGSPAAGWPCLADAVGAGRGCFGHGRGMSQWGTQRWAIHATTPRNWRWIVDHYYNDNDDASGAGSGLRTAVLTSPLLLSAPVPLPATLEPGQVLQIHAQATNLAAAPHAQLLIGASLYRSGSGYLDDPAHDAPLVLPPGAHAIERSFTLPANADAGSYDLLLSLFLDVDENAVISATDLALALVTAPAAVTVTLDRIFVDGFEVD